MKNNIKNYPSIKSVKPITARKFYESKTAEMIQMILNKDENIPLHSIDWDAVFIVERGKLHFTENGSEYIIEEHDFIVSDRGNEHGFVNREEETAILLIIKLK